MLIPSAARVHYGCVIFVRILQGLVEVSLVEKCTAGVQSANTTMKQRLVEYEMRCIDPIYYSRQDNGSSFMRDTQDKHAGVQTDEEENTWKHFLNAT